MTGVGRALAILMLACAVHIASFHNVAAGLARPEGDARVALVIGNGAYEHTVRLANPGNDGEDVAAALGVLGFRVHFVRDANKAAIDDALSSFARDATAAEVALFYYAGHGMQFEGRNFLMPVDAALADAKSLDRELVDIGAVKATLAHAGGVKILVLDACRDNPLSSEFIRATGGRGIDGRIDPVALRGLGRIERVSGMVIAYATQADAVAQDGTGRNSPFSSAFLHQIRQRGLELGVLFRRISTEVFTETGGRQEPEVSISNIPDYYLNGEPAGGAPIVPTAPAAPAITQPGPAIEPRLVMHSIRSELRRLGCYVGPDAEWGTPAVMNALAETRRRAPALVADATPSLALLEQLDGMPAHLCPSRQPPPAAVHQTTRHPQVHLLRPHEPHKKPTQAVAAVSAAAAGSRCFSFKGKGYCE